MTAGEIRRENEKEKMVESACTGFAHDPLSKYLFFENIVTL